jgi:hypothetical protein
MEHRNISFNAFEKVDSWQLTVDSQSAVGSWQIGIWNLEFHPCFHAPMPPCLHAFRHILNFVGN